MVHYHLYKSPPPVPIPSQINPVHVPQLTSWRCILVLSSLLSLGLPSGLFPSGFHTKTLQAPAFSPISATCLGHLIHLNLISRIILGEKYRLLGPLLCSFLHPPVTSSLLGPNILLSTLFLNTLSLRSSLMCKSKLKLHLPFDNIRYFDCAAAQLCSTSGVSSAVEMFLPYTHDFIGCHIHFVARENNTLCFNLLFVHWKTGLQYHCGWLSVCLFHCSNFGTNFWDVMKFLCTSCHQKAIYFYVFILYHIGAITERVSMHEDIHSLQAVRHQTLLK